MVQYNMPQNTPKYIDMQRLLLCFQCDPDLASLPQTKLEHIMSQLYIVTGCDYISYTAGIGKATYLKHFFQHSEFISGCQITGCLSQTNKADMSMGFLSFLRLVDTVYFKKNLSTVVTKLGCETPNQLLNSFNTTSDDQERHHQWYKRAIRVYAEDQRPPTITALQRHWIRSCWIKGMWENSCKSDLYDALEAPETQGWLKLNEISYCIDWEANDVAEKIQATLDFLSKGCSCKTGCQTRKCGCKKASRSCGAGCECQNCQNMQKSVYRNTRHQHR